MKTPTQKEIRDAAKNTYGSGSYWQGVKTDAFREGVKWILDKLKKLNSDKEDKRSVASKAK